MVFGSSIFWDAFQAAGMLEAAVYQPSSGPAIEFLVGFTRPDQVVLDGVAHATDYTIEYQAADIQLRRDDVVTVAGLVLRVTHPPRAKGDGSFYVANLERAS